MSQRKKIIVCLVMLAMVALSFLFMPLSARGANVGDYQVSQCTSASGSMPVWSVRTVTPAANAYSLAGFSNTAVAGVPVASNYTFGTGFTISGSAPNFIISTTESPGGATWGSITGTLSNQTDLQNALNAKAPVTSGTSLLYGNGSGGFSNATVSPHGNLTFSGGTLDTAQNLTTGDSPTFGGINVPSVTASANLVLNVGTSGNVILPFLSGYGSGPFEGFYVVGGASDSGYVVDGYGGAGTTPRMVLRRAEGSASSPSAVLSNDTLGSINAGGYNGSAFTGSAVGFTLQATENWSGSANGSDMSIYFTPAGTTTAQIGMLFGYVNQLLQIGVNNVVVSYPTITTTGAELCVGLNGKYNDSNSSGTVASSYLDVFHIVSISASNAVTYTDAVRVAILGPMTASGGNVTFTRQHSFAVIDSTSASSSITGAVVIATTLGTSSTSVGIGGGNVNAGGTVTANALSASSATISSITAASSTDLTLFGGSSGAEIDLGNGASAANITLTPTGTGVVTLNATLNYGVNGNFVITGNSGGNNNIDLEPGGTGFVRLFSTSGANVVARSTPTGLDIGVNNGASVAAWGNAGLQILVPASSYTDSTSATGTVATAVLNSFAGSTINASNSSVVYTDLIEVYMTPPFATGNASFTRKHTLAIVDSTSAASSITGAVVVASTLGTSGSSVGIGNGNINAGGTITAGGQMFAAVGSNSAPAYASASNNNTGLYFTTTPTVIISVGGSGVATFTSTGINNTAIGATTTSTGAFTTLKASSTLTFSGGFTANGTTALSLTALGPASAHATVQEWLTVSDGTNTRYIPAF